MPEPQPPESQKAPLQSESQPQAPHVSCLTPNEPSATIREQAWERARQHLSAAYVELLVAGGHPPAKEPLSEIEIHTERVRKTLGDSDISLIYDIRVVDSEGLLYRVADDVKMSFFTEQDMLGESRRNFEAAFYTAIVRPVFSRIQSYIARFVENRNPLPAQPIFGRHAHPAVPIPAPGPQAFLT